MPKIVIKRKNPAKRINNVEEFDIEKLRNSIYQAGIQAGRSREELVSLIEEVAGYVLEKLENIEEIYSQDIRKLILDYLESKYLDIYHAWIEYEKTVKGRTDEEF